MAEDTRERATIISIDRTTAPVIERSHGCLVIIYGAHLGRRIALDAPVECGRASECDVSLDDEAVSRRHARVGWNGSAYSVRDLGSTNGTFVNGEQVNEKTLRSGDQIKVGHNIFKFLSGDAIEAAYHEEIYRMMTVDGLTRVHNKRAFDQALERELSRSIRYRRALSLVLFDVDHFKQINDTRGHLAGDSVLTDLAGIAANNVRREDFLARVGGEEFALLLPEVALEGARVVAEKLRGLIAAHAFTFEGKSFGVTASFGAASLEANREVDAAALYGAADGRLYEAKRGGRNRVV
jgi:diguanylate cyclase (GGDEF)-like protein